MQISQFFMNGDIKGCLLYTSHGYWPAAAQREQRAGTSGEGVAAAWKRQEGKLRPMMQPHKPKIGSGTAHQRLALPELPDNQARFAALLREFSEVRENRHVNDADFAYSWYAYGMEHYLSLIHISLCVSFRFVLFAKITSLSSKFAESFSQSTIDHNLSFHFCTKNARQAFLPAGRNRVKNTVLYMFQ